MFLMVLSDNALRVVLADDHHFFREGLREMLAADGMTVVGEAHDGARAIKLVRELDPDVVVLDLSMPNGSGIVAVRQIASANPDARLVVLTVSADEADELVGSIRLAAGGHAVLSRDVVRALVARAHTNNHKPERTSDVELQLTARELDVIRLIADGADNAAIGLELSISRHTVKQYVTNIFEKLGVQSRVQAAVYAVRNGLV
jgi:DNA-binding NarL/FixJ family response regulator